MNWPSYLLGFMTGMLALDIARRVGMVAWAVMVTTTLKPLWRVLSGHARFYDVLWTTIGGIAFLILMYGVRAIYAPDSNELLLGLYIMSTLMAISTMFVVRAYMHSHKATGHG